MKLFRNTLLGIGLALIGHQNAMAEENFTPDQPKNVVIDVGFGARNLTPLVIITGVSYKNVGLRLQGLGIHNGPNDFWCGFRGGLFWKFFKELPYSFDVGVGGGYDFAEAPNKMHQAINDANDALYVLPYNYKENLDASLELWTHLYGFYTQIGIPFYQFRDHDSPSVLWGAGYMVSF